MNRDNYTCAATGALWEGRETWDLKTDTSKTAYDLEITHVIPDFRRLFLGKVRPHCTYRGPCTSTQTEARALSMIVGSV